VATIAEHRVELLVRRARSHGWVASSQVRSLAAELGLSDEALEDVYERLDAVGVELRDHVGQRSSPVGGQVVGFRCRSRASETGK
jgi:hypothetical protein